MKKPACVIFVVMAIAAFGCAGIQYQDQPQSSHTLDQQRQKSRTRVLAKAENWRNSGVVVEKGKTYNIAAKGRWVCGVSCGWTGPDGLGAHSILCPDIGQQIVKGWSINALIGRVSENGEPFAIGNDLALSPAETGILYYRINDTPGMCGDNDGFVDVDIVLADADRDRVSQPAAGMPPADTGLKTAGQTQMERQYHKGQKWAVVIGISDYRDSRIPSLRYAAGDAQAFYSWLVSQKGGMYAPSRIRLLLNTEATGKAVKNALFNWLGQALEEDTVIIFFAGHGSPQSPDQPQNMFLLPSDTQYDDIATTGFPMWDIETALRRFIKAKKVIVFADACHSGGVGEQFEIARRSSRAVEVNPISSGLQNLSKVGDGVAVFSASDDKQLSQESRNWGGGHGVFTYYLLKGLAGEADYNKDASITLGELIPYVSEQVRRATRNAQSPTVSGKFDPALSVGR